jgi:hypothetical protein
MKCNFDECKCKYNKKNRLIYHVYRQLSKEEIEEIVEHSEIDFFSIETFMFENVKTYYSMIDLINAANRKFSKAIGIIAELGGRKFKVQNIVASGNASDELIHLKKGERVKIKWSANIVKKIEKTNHKKIIYVNFKDFHELVNLEDEIILNDNRGCLKVVEKKEKEVKILDKIRQRSPIRHTIHASLIKQRMNHDGQHRLSHDSDEREEKAGRRKSIDNSLKKVLSVEEGNISHGFEMYDYDERTKHQFKKQKATSFIRKSSIRFSQDMVEKLENLIVEPHPQKENFQTRNSRLKSNCRASVVKELICEVEYDCTINKNSFIFIPNADYKSLGIDLLSCREVNELAHLERKGVHFICITIKDMDDIKSIREILSEESRMKILASIPDIAVKYLNIQLFKRLYSKLRKFWKTPLD